MNVFFTKSLNVCHFRSYSYPESCSQHGDLLSRGAALFTTSTFTASAATDSYSHSAFTFDSPSWIDVSNPWRDVPRIAAAVRLSGSIWRSIHCSNRSPRYPFRIALLRRRETARVVFQYLRNH